MKKNLSIILAVTLMLALVVGIQGVALADDSISTSVKLNPTSLPGEGTVSVSVTIKNNGDPISNVQLKYPSPTDTVIDLGSMASGDTKTHDNGSWHIYPEMLDKSLNFTVMWTSADGTSKSGNTPSFDIQQQEQQIKLSGTATADANEVDKGSRVKFTFSLKNEGNVELENIQLTAPMIDNGAQIGEAFSLEPGATNNKTYTVAVNDNMNVAPVYTYTLNGQSYTYKLSPLNIAVKEAPKTITMGITLAADKDKVEAGGMVNFTIQVQNTGTSNLDGLVAKDFDGNTVPLTPASLPPGGTATGSTSIPIANAGNYQFTVSAVGAGGEALNQRSNTVQIATDGEAKPTANADDVIDPSRVIRTEVSVPSSPVYGPTEGIFKATVTNLTDQELKNVLVINDILGTIGQVDVLKAGESKTFEHSHTLEETASYMFVTTAALPDGTLIESKTNEATIVVEKASGMSTTTVWFVVILVAIAVVGIALAIYIFKSRKTLKAQEQARKERSAQVAQRYRTGEKPQASDYPSAEQRTRMNSKPEYPDRSVYTNRKPRSRVETLDPPTRGSQPTPPKKPGARFEDRNKF